MSERKTDMTESSKTEYRIDPFGKGYVQIYTGDGKGKTTAALGLALRAAGAGLRVYIAQFIKEMEYGEVGVLRERFPEIEVELFGTEAGCIVGRKTTEEDVRAAREGMERVRQVIREGRADVVILDEVTIPVSLNLIPEEDILRMMEEKPEKVELILTGRGATEEMLSRADLVTEMKEVRHYYREGVLSRKGIEC